MEETTNVVSTTIKNNPIVFLFFVENKAAGKLMSRKLKTTYKASTNKVITSLIYYTYLLKNVPMLPFFLEDTGPNCCKSSRIF